MREPKSVTVGIQWRGWWDIVGNGRDEQELEVQVKKAVVVDSGEPVKLKLRDLGSEPFSKSDFVIVEVRPLEDIKIPLMLLCVRRWVVSMAGNGGLLYVTYVKLVWVLDPHRCSPELSTGSRFLSAHTLRASHQVEHYARVTVVKGCRSLFYLRMDTGTTGNYGSVS